MLDTGDTVLNVVHSVCPQGATFCWDGVWDGDQEGAVKAAWPGEDRALDWAVVWRSREWRMDPVMC